MAGIAPVPSIMGPGGNPGIMHAANSIGTNPSGSKVAEAGHQSRPPSNAADVARSATQGVGDITSAIDVARLALGS